MTMESLDTSKIESLKSLKDVDVSTEEGREKLSKEIEAKIPSVFDIAKSGMLMPMQTVVQLKGLDILQEKDDNGNYPLHWVCINGHMSLLRYFLDLKVPISQPNETEIKSHPIHWACVKGHISVVDLLLQNGADINVVDAKGCTPLIIAAQYGQTMLAGYLMGKGADIHRKDHEGDTCLHWAAFKGQSELMRLLIYSGLNPLQVDNFGQSPLHLASICGNLTAVKELCELEDANPVVADKNGKTPLDLATGRKHNDVIRYLSALINKKTNWWLNLPKFDFTSLLFGPPGNPKYAFMFLITQILFWGYPVYIFVILPKTFQQLQSLHMIFIIFNIILWICLFYAVTQDPGLLPQNTEEYHQTIKQIAHFSEWSAGRNPLSRLCHTCRAVKPLRSKHCRNCNRCVRDFDHHCPYIYNCVGAGNRGWFACFVWTIAILGWISAYIGYHMYSYFPWDWLIMLGMIPTIFFTFMTTFLSGAILVNIATNMTTNERLNQKRYDYLKDGQGNFHNPFDNGIKHNFETFFKLRRPPATEELNILSYSVV